MNFKLFKTEQNVSTNNYNYKIKKGQKSLIHKIIKIKKPVYLCSTPKEKTNALYHPNRYTIIICRTYNR